MPQKLLIESTDQTFITVIQSLLEGHGITPIIKNQIAFQVGNSYSMGASGVQILIDEKDWLDATTLLVEQGYGRQIYYQQEDLTGLKSILDKLRILPQTPIAIRLFLLLIIVSVLLTIGIAIGVLFLR